MEIQLIFVILSLIIGMAVTTTKIFFYLYRDKKPLSKKEFFFYSLGWPGIIFMALWFFWDDRSGEHLLVLIPWLMSLFLSSAILYSVMGEFWDLFLSGMAISVLWGIIVLTTIFILFIKWQINERSS